MNPFLDTPLKTTALSIYKPEPHPWEQRAPSVNIYDLHRQMQQKKVRRFQHFDSILDKVYKRIQSAATIDQVRILYEVPEFVVGIPMFNIHHCIAYLITELRQKEFFVQYYFPRILYISWDPKECKKGWFEETKMEPPSLEPSPPPYTKKTAAPRKPPTRSSFISSSPTSPPPAILAPSLSSAEDPLKPPTFKIEKAFQHHGGNSGLQRNTVCKPSGKFILNLS